MRTIVVVVADGNKDSRLEVAKAWQTLLLGLSQNHQILQAYNLDSLLNMARHGGIGNSEVDLVSVSGGFSNGDNPRGWLLPRNGGCASAHSLQDYLRCNGYRRLILAVAHDATSLSSDKFDGIWRTDEFLRNPLKFAAKARGLLALHK